MGINKDKLKFYFFSALSIAISWVGFMGFINTYTHPPTGDTKVYSGTFKANKDRCDSKGCYGTFTTEFQDKTVQFSNVYSYTNSQVDKENFPQMFGQAGQWKTRCDGASCTVIESALVYYKPAAKDAGRWLSLGVGIFGLAFMYMVIKRLYPHKNKQS